MIDGGLRVARGDFESARDDYGRALAIRDRVLGTGHPLNAEAQAGLATALAGTGEVLSHRRRTPGGRNGKKASPDDAALPARAPVSDLRRDSTQGARPRDVSRGDRLRGGRPRVRRAGAQPRTRPRRNGRAAPAEDGRVRRCRAALVGAHVGPPAPGEPRRPRRERSAAGAVSPAGRRRAA